jgi:acyl dehydratase
LILKDPKELKELVDKEIVVGEWFQILQERIHQFAEATEDRQWIHLDSARASSESPYASTIAHGFLTLSLISHLFRSAVQFQGGVRMAVNYGLNRVRFPSAVPAGSRIRIRASLKDYQELADAVQATYAITVELENSDKPCCVAEWILRYYF